MITDLEKRMAEELGRLQAVAKIALERTKGLQFRLETFEKELDSLRSFLESYIEKGDSNGRDDDQT